MNTPSIINELKKKPEQGKQAKPYFFLLFPNIFGFKGGIQVYSAFLLSALQELYPTAEYDVFLKYDCQTSPNLHFFAKTQFHYFGKWPRLLQTFLFAAKIMGLGVWLHPSLIISTHINYSVVCYLLKCVCGIDYWVIAHGLECWNIKNPVQRLALRYADRILAVSHYTRNRLLTEQSIDPSKILILPNTFDSSRFQISPKPSYLLKRYNLTSQQPVILTVTRIGRSAHYKNYDQLLRSLVRVRQHIPNVRYILVGKGDDRLRIETLVASLDLQDCVTITGFVPDEELCDHYNLCDVFALPSQGEGFGIVYLEALACGKPVLAGKQDGSVDPLNHGELGCLVDPNNVDAIADNLIQIIQGTYPNPLLYQPKLLRQRTIESFEFAQFRQIFAQLIQNI